MNKRQAEALRTVLEASHPDAATTVTAQPDGAAVTISGTLKTPGLSGPGGSADVVLRLGENSPLLLHFLAARLARADRAAE
jgi:hypothetical protein